MPISKYYSGHGRQVMKSMKEKYGEEKGERVFYATANKRGQTAEANPASPSSAAQQTNRRADRAGQGSSGLSRRVLSNARARR